MNDEDEEVQIAEEWCGDYNIGGACTTVVCSIVQDDVRGISYSCARGKSPNVNYFDWKKNNNNNPV